LRREIMEHPSSLSARLFPIERFVLTCIRKGLDPLGGYWLEQNILDTTDSLIAQDMIELDEMTDEETPVTTRITEKGITALWEQ
jgi:hypothetical protein